LLIFVSMSSRLFDTTICALATAGRGALSLIRMSGPASLDILNSVFRPARKSEEWISAAANTTHFGYVTDGQEVIDEVVVSLFRAPHSYTGEDSVELSCHGSSYIEQKIIQLLLNAGAVPARPGEFTQRAFLNGKMDLSQAEAVADLIASETEGAHRVAMNQLRGGFSREISKLRERMIYFSSMIELELDFSEEDVEFADRSALLALADEALELVKRLAASFKAGNAIKNGVPVAIAGAPNVGKSTLLNALLNDDRAIVSEIAGTTRDTIEDTIVIDGVLFRFIDTAGIRDTDDSIESMGIERTFRKIEQASLVLYMAEAGDKASSLKEGLQKVRAQAGPDKPVILLINKIDKIDEGKLASLLEGIEGDEQVRILPISALNGLNMDRLTKLLSEVVNLGELRHQDLIITNIRHYHALTEAAVCLERVRSGISGMLTGELLAQDLREAILILGEITGEVSTDEILGSIFKNFCIGK